MVGLGGPLRVGGALGGALGVRLAPKISLTGAPVQCLDRGRVPAGIEQRERGAA